jgi:hypothetical protein
MRTARIVLVGICVSGMLTISAALLSSRPWRSADTVNESIVKQTPPGSSVEQVQQYITRQGWGIFLDFQGNTATSPRDTPAGVMGFHILGAKLPEYGFPFRIHTEAYWGFDVYGKLADVKVRSWLEWM